MASIQGVYLALFGRPADPLGLAFFNQATGNGANLTAIGDLASTAEYQTRFTGQSTTQIITSIYQSLFNREPDLAGLTFFATALANGTLNINNIAIAIYDGAQGSDLTIRNLKEAAANAFTAQIDTVAEINGYSGTAAAQSAAAFIATVTTTAPTADQVSAAVAASTAVGGASGQTFTLTTAVDNIAGTSANDTINAFKSATGGTLSAADTINGGSGVDTLNITVDQAGNVLAGALISNIENVGIRATDNVALTLDATGFTGVTLTGTNTTTTTLSNVANNASVTVGSGANLTGKITAGYVAAATTANLAYAGGTSGAVDVTGAGITTLNIASTGAANTAGAIDGAAAKTINVNAASNLTAASIATTDTAATLNVAGSAASVNVGTLDTGFTTVDASKLTAGGLTATLSGTATVKVTGGAGNDVITTGGVLTTGTVDAGAGTADRLVLVATADLATAALGAKYTNFEVLQVQDAQTGNLDNISGITSIRLNDGAGTTIVSNLSATQAGAITMLDTNGNVTIGVKNASNVGQIDTVKITVNDGDTTLSEAGTAAATPTLTGVENLEITAVDDAAFTLSNANAGSLTSVKLFGAGDHSLITGNIATANFSLDASASTGANTLNANGFSTNGVAIKGGTGVDTITGSAQADLIDGGAGKDVISGGDGEDTLTGGADADTFQFVAGDLSAAPSATVFDKITDFAKGSDIIDDTAAALTIVTNAVAAVGTAAISAEGIATFNAADDTLAEKLTAAEAGINAGGAAAAGQFAIFEHSGNSYLFISDGTDGIAATDVFVELTGVTGLSDSTLTGGNLTIA